MLIRLLRTYLLRYRGLLLVVLALTFVQTMGTLFLPTLNADIIDKGVATGDTAYIWRVGGLMLVVTLRAGACSRSPRCTTAPGSRWRSGATSAARCSTGSPTSPPRTSPRFGAPSLITRITNDVTQVQILVLMSCTLLVAAPITIIGGVDHGRARGRTALAAPARERPGARSSASASSSCAWSRSSR